MEENLPATFSGGTLADAVGNDLPKALKLVETLANAEGLPKHLAKKPATFLLYLQISQEFRIGLTVAIANFYVVNGNLTAKSDFMIDRARMAGHYVKHEIKGLGKETTVTTVIVRKEDVEEYKNLRAKLGDALGDDGLTEKIRSLMAELEHRCTWNWKKATQAGVNGKDTWLNYPDAMLRHRADSQCVRMACGEVLGAAQYTPEELGGDVREDGSYLITSVPEKMTAPTPANVGAARITQAAPTPVTVTRVNPPKDTVPPPAPVSATKKSDYTPPPAKAAAPAPTAQVKVPVTVAAKTATVVEDKKPVTSGTAVAELPKINGHTNAQDLFGAVYDMIATGAMSKELMRSVEADVTKFRLATKLVSVPIGEGESKKILLSKALKEIALTAKLG